MGILPQEDKSDRIESCREEQEELDREQGRAAEHAAESKRLVFASGEEGWEGRRGEASHTNLNRRLK